jgi:hypothetical protein
MIIGMAYTYSALSEASGLLPRVEIPMRVHAKQSWFRRVAVAAAALATVAFMVTAAPRSAIDAAHSICGDPTDYPLSLITSAETVLATQAGSQSIPVGEVAERDKWFVD